MLSYTNPTSGQCGCECGTLPNTITIGFSGLANTGRSMRQLLSASACFGGQARAVLLEPGEPGPLGAVQLLSPGACYASKGRIQPTLTVRGGGTGAVFTVTLTESQDTCGRSRWSIGSITVAGGSGYTDFSLLQITPAPGDTTEIAAVARVRSTGGVPTSVTISNAGRYYREVAGDRDVPIVSVAPLDCGARFGVTVDQLPDTDPPLWGVAGVTLEDRGNGGCTAGSLVFETGDLTAAAEAATATYTVNADGEVDSVTLHGPGGYYRDISGVAPYVADVVFSFTFEPGAAGGEIRGIVDADPSSATFGELTGVTVTKAGDGYKAWEPGETCAHLLNGSTLVLQAQDGIPLVRVCARPSFGVAPNIVIDYSDYDGVPGPLPEPSFFAPVTGGLSTGGGMARKGRVPPTLTVVPGFGSGATFGVALRTAQTPEGFDYWEVDSITADGNGSGYQDGFEGYLSYTPGDSIEAWATYRLWTRTDPVVAAAIQQPSGFEGEPASVSVTLERLAGLPPVWTIASIVIESPGSGYPAWSAVSLTVSSPTYAVKPAAAFAHADADGRIIAIELRYGGEYYRSDGKPRDVEVLSRGRYYRESDEAPPYIASVPVEVEQIHPSNGAGAAVSVQIDTDPASPTFGRATSISLDSAGDGYALLGGPKSCRYGAQCANSLVQATLLGNKDFANAATATSTAAEGGRNRGMELRIEVSTSSDGPVAGGVGFTNVFRSTEPIVDCDELPSTLPRFYGNDSGSVSVTRGGRALSKRGNCCVGCACGNNPDLSHIASVTVVIEWSLTHCELSGTFTAVLTEENGWQFQQYAPAEAELPDVFLSAGFGCYQDSFRVDATVTDTGLTGCRFCPELGVGGSGFSRARRMEGIDVGDRCVPLGFEGWQWQPGVEFPEFCTGSSVTVSATVALA